MNLKDCLKIAVPSLTVAMLLESDLDFEPLALPKDARIVAVEHYGADVQLFYTIAPQGLPQGDIDKLVRLTIRKGLRLTDGEALSYLTEHAIHQYGVGRLTNLSLEQYDELVKWLRFDAGGVQLASSL